MLVAELVLRKLYTEDEIKEFESYVDNITALNYDKELASQHYHNVTNRLFELYDKLQNQRVILRKCNDKTKVVIDGNTLSVTDALEIANTIEKRLAYQTNLINNHPNVDIFGTVQSRRELLEEYLKLMRCIKRSDWTTDVG